MSRDDPTGDDPSSDAIDPSDGTDEPRSDAMSPTTTTTDRTATDRTATDGPEASATPTTAPDGLDAAVTGVAVVDDEPTDGVPTRGAGEERRSARRAADRPEQRDGAAGVNLVLAVLAIVGLAGTLIFGFKWNQERTADGAQASMETTASDFLVALFDFDGRTIDADFDNILDYATGEFADQAEAQFADDDTRAALREVQASSRVEVRDLFVQSFDGDRGRVFAVVDQTIANNQFPNPRSDQVRLEVGLRKVDGEWKVATLDVLEAPAAAAAIAGGTVPTGDPATTATTGG